MNTVMKACFVSILGSFLLVGCGGDDDDGGGTSSAGTGGGTTGTGGTGGSTGGGDTKLGPSCDAYAKCCEELAQDQPQMAGACDQFIESAEKSISQNPDTKDQLESSCQQAIDSAQTMDYCK